MPGSEVRETNIASEVSDPPKVDEQPQSEEVPKTEEQPSQPVVNENEDGQLPTVEQAISQ